MASTTLRISIALRCSSSKKAPSFLGNSRGTSTNYLPPSQPLSCFTGLAFSRRRGESSLTSKKINKKKNIKKNVGEGEDVDEDAFEALFQQLEEDLKNDELNGEDDDISEEELAKLEQELAEALGDDELFGALASVIGEETMNENEEEEEEDDDDDDDGVVDDPIDDDSDDGEEEEMQIKLKSWQQRRLAYALKDGRRKTSIKNLAADLCLDRAVVLKLLRDPPPNLIMLSATLPDKPAPSILEPVEQPVETVPLETTTHTAEPEQLKEKLPTTTHTAEPEQLKEKLPVHVMQSNWSARKRLKKVQVETLEEVYKRTKRPTNAMVSSIVHVTNLPRKKVVKWFEDKRAEEGVPEHRVPYQRSDTDSVFTS